MDTEKIIIELNNVTKTFKTGAGEVTVLKGINLLVKAGEFVSIVGPSGSGKSTLINMITGIDRPTRGEVVVAGEMLNHLTENQLAHWRGRTVGVIFQFFQLLPTLTILENIILPMDFARVIPAYERKERALELLNMVGIRGHADKLPSALSGGEQQRAAIARSLANDPSLILADEPTGNLDTVNAREIFALFGKLVEQGKTFLIVTHDRNLSKQTWRTIHFLDGCIQKDESKDGRHGANNPVDDIVLERVV